MGGNGGPRYKWDFAIEAEKEAEVVASADKMEYQDQMLKHGTCNLQ